MKPYLDLLRDVRNNGTRKPTRATLRSTGENIDSLSVFGRQIRFDLSEGFPLITTKRISFNAIVHELIWFLRGETNIAYLRQHGIKIWDQWADSKGDLGPVYGRQWRSWPTPDGQHIDQIANLIEDIKAVRINPISSVSRRLIVTSWNPAEIGKMALPPCHTLFQFDVTNDKLSCQLYQRSADLFLGVPFNIASYALLTMLIAKVTGLEPGEFIHTFGNAHIYLNHIDQVDIQLKREPSGLSQVLIDPEVKDLETICREHIALVGYRSYPTIQGEVAV